MSITDLLINAGRCLSKSQLTGFFAFICLTACQPSSPSQQQLMDAAKTDPVAAVTLAQQRLIQKKDTEALNWFRQAALLGDVSALQQALKLQWQQESLLPTAYWLQQQFDSGNVSADMLPLSTLQELGLWRYAPVKPANNTVRPESCSLTLQPVASYQAGVRHWQNLQRQWQDDPQLNQLNVCFLPLVTVDSTALACTEYNQQRIQCNYMALNTLVDSHYFSQLVVVAGKGVASYNNGIVQLPDNSSFELFRHEFMHILGFIDEYALSAAAAQEVCQSEIIRPNLIIEADSTAIQRYLRHWQLSAEQLELTPVETCQNQQKTAFRVVQETNLMRFYETELPALYFELMKKVLQQPQHIMPVQYYFAYLARQQQDWLLWQKFMQHAAEHGYADAQQALSE